MFVTAPAHARRTPSPASPTDHRPLRPRVAHARRVPGAVDGPSRRLGVSAHNRRGVPLPWRRRGEVSERTTGTLKEKLIASLAVCMLCASGGCADHPVAEGSRSRDQGAEAGGAGSRDAGSRDAGSRDAGSRDGGASPAPSFTAVVPWNYCQDRCESDADCESNWICTEHRCAPNNPPQPACSTDEDCAARYLSERCAAQADCAFVHACVDLGAAGGRCVFRVNPRDINACAAGPTFTDVSGAPVAVCISGQYRCVQGSCSQCRFDEDCGDSRRCRADGKCVDCLTHADCSGRTPVCYEQSTCGCATDDNCRGWGDKCAMDGTCTGCTSDADCVDSRNRSLACLEGAVCGCRDVSQCAAEPSEATTVVCEPLRL